MTAESFVSVSTWQQPDPPPASSRRRDLIEALSRRIAELSAGRLRVAVDGFTASGKTSFAHELGAALRELGRPTLRASLDDFMNPWREARLYDRVSGEGYYRNAWDFGAARELLLEPMAADGSGEVVLCSIDPITQVNHQAVKVYAPENAVLVVDGVFALRPQYNDAWDFRIFLEVDLELSIERGATRDAETEGDRDAAERLHRDRYAAAERIYVAEVGPASVADVVIDNRDFREPRVLRG
jgi:uridine kinase